MFRRWYSFVPSRFRVRPAVRLWQEGAVREQPLQQVVSLPDAWDAAEHGGGKQVQLQPTETERPQRGACLSVRRGVRVS
jgi:hypothetical protein